MSYEEIGRMYGCTGSNIRRVAKRLNISIVKRRSINANETFNKGKKLVTRVCLNCGKELSNHNSTTKYCNNVCQAEYKHKEYIRRWKEGEETGKFTVESREYDILDGTCTVILDQQITWTEHPQEYNDAMLAYEKRWNNTIDLSCEDFFKMKQLVQRGTKLQAVKHVKESTKCGLKEAKDFVDTYCDYVLND